MTKEKSYTFDNFEIKLSDMSLYEHNVPVKLEPQVYRLLALLVARHPEIVTKEEINEHVWNGRIVSDAALSSRLRSARAAIGDNGKSQKLIKTIPNVGLKFIGNVTKHPLKTTKPHLTHISKKTKTLLFAATILCLGMLALWLAPYFTLRSQFVVTQNAAIKGHNVKILNFTSLTSCMQACLNETAFSCKSFDYSKVLQTCDLSDKTAIEVGGLKTDYPHDPYAHYSRKKVP